MAFPRSVLRLTSAAAMSLVLPAAAQDSKGDAALPVGDVATVLDAEALDQGRFLALVAAGARAVPGLLAAVGGGEDESPLALRARGRALRALRLIGPQVADAAVPTLLAAVARDISRDDTELLLTFGCLAPGVDDRAAMVSTAQAIEIAAPNPQAPGGREQFRNWVAKMRLWYDFQHRLRWEATADVELLIERLRDEDPLRRRFAAEQLGRIGRPAAAAIDALMLVADEARPPRVTRIQGTGSLTADFGDLLQPAAAIAIARIDPSHPRARRGLALLLQADAPQERFGALMAMARAPEDAFDVRGIAERARAGLRTLTRR